MHTDASKWQIGGVLSQEGKALSYFSKKFNSAQERYTVTAKELLAIVETLKAFRNILLGNKIRIYTDHKNLTYLNSDYSSDRVLRQRLVVEEYGAEIIYIKGTHNIVADALSRIPIMDGRVSASAVKEEKFLQRRAFEDEIPFPLDLQRISELQKDDNHLERLMRDRRSNHRIKRDDHQGTKLWMYNGKVFVPKEARAPMAEWFHENLLHAGPQRTSATMRQHFDWPGAVAQIEKYIKKCPKCQKCKLTGVKKYGKVPLLDEDEADIPPFHTVQVDMIGPWSVKFNMLGKTVAKQIKALTMVDKATTWPEITSVKTKESLEVSEHFDNQ